MKKTNTKNAQFIWVLLLLFIFVQACHSGKNMFSSKRLAHLTAGMSKERVHAIAGPPDQQFVFDDERFVYYYRMRQSDKESDDLAGDYTAVSFEEGRVLTIGQDLREFWESAETEGKAVQMSAAERKARIKALEDEVRPIPVSEARKNLKLYRQLLALDPENSRYIRKIDFYRKRVVASQMESGPQASRPVTSISPDMNVESRSKAGADSTGHTENKARSDVDSDKRDKKALIPIDMEVVKLKNGVFFVWMKNLSDEKILITSEAFSVMDTGKQFIPFDVSPTITQEVSPGSSVQGKLSCREEETPVMLFFTHEKIGTMTKRLR